MDPQGSKFNSTDDFYLTPQYQNTETHFVVSEMNIRMDGRTNALAQTTPVKTGQLFV
jgi:hypothetical protein